MSPTVLLLLPARSGGRSSALRPSGSRSAPHLQSASSGEAAQPPSPASSPVPAPAATALAQAAGPAGIADGWGDRTTPHASSSCNLWGVLQIEDRFYIYLEYVHPGSINKYVKQHYGAMTESVIRNFTRHILRRLAFLHGQKIMHRDIKGANLLVDVQGVVKLADFGMAKHLSTAAPNLSLKGTPYWMAPEMVQATLMKDVGYDLAVDIWSLGCTIIEMFNGKPPWSDLEGVIT
ncbi:unnamed protein product [Miscanthus lutarioriparius]|uniref:Protein kinase domain-containing protein n=1 Tax=Miscanthus lutarioriparius TaxID=422564 RepID=A0A811RIT9_9POAL|nr:unnamed protein product [Miscanthus lutarioriparius]